MLRKVRNFAAFLVVIAAMVGLSVAVRAVIPGGRNTAGPDLERVAEPPLAATELPTQGPPILERTGASGFQHPGVLVGVEQLEVARNAVRSQRQPWLRAYEVMSRSDYAKLTWIPMPRQTVECGYFSNPNHGCNDEYRDAIAAYTHALMWYLTGREAHAQKAAEILDAWATTLQQHTNNNAPIQAAWSATTFVRAAELLRHAYPDWSPAGVEAMLRTAFLPLVADGGAPGSGGNWDLIILNAAMSIAVFLDDRKLFDRALAKVRARVPAYIYLSSDGPSPVPPPGGLSGSRTIVDFWFGQTTYVNGLTQETCRDLGHTAWGLEAIVQIAETAWLHGIDLYGEVESRLTSALEFHAGLALGDEVPGWLCGGRLNDTFHPIPEIALHHYSQRRGIPMPRTRELVMAGRPQAASYFYGWGTLLFGSTKA